ncbi:uncharacterized protein BT62DRAFT_928240 [Guyanagaster necrorhizus]|uniref:Uncharacterized protein n=1 Tax=Guyanagaster necrorhizus TaxID=856835 RepID=A0A9P7VYY8_9AGAR|nr:uncharacterized protein BT62DRAFT_928240 [Guyanagaster necrorhizus MCA 3950]KAG7449522.1 hypothetical protein BT62DRAFT_928240 [Guyanagaster necrorhizus MCA 3950]
MASEPVMPSLSPRSLSGCRPGLLDPSQPQRLLRYSTSQISFASFNPRTATAQADLPDFRKLSLQEELYNAKRVVIETSASGESFWRFVPRAHLDEGVLDEGTWPRLVNLCGELVELSQDQWDIYKLDTFYECRVCPPPAYTIISIAPSKPPPPSHLPNCKRHLSPSFDFDNAAPSSNYPKTADDALISEEEDEVEDMIIDDEPAPPPRRAKSAVPRREEMLKKRNERRDRNSQREEKLSSPLQSPFNFTGYGPTPSTPTPKVKRKVHNVFESLKTPPDPDYSEFSEEARRQTATYEHVSWTKRNRTVSPAEARRHLDHNRTTRQKRKAEKIRAQMRQHNQRWQSELMPDIYDELARMPASSSPERHFFPETVEEEPEDVQHNFYEERDDRAEREASIAASRAKLADLEADRPLWEAAASARQLREQAEAEAHQAKVEARRQTEESRVAEQRAEKARKREADACAREDAARREREATEQLEHAWQQREARWNTGYWTPARAIARYKEYSELFDVTKFAADPLEFRKVPWPILKRPSKLSTEDVDWANVEEFFAEAKKTMRLAEFREFVEKSHRRFHPDRWRSRGALNSVVDEVAKSYMEVAANTVAQALTPLWREVKR